jgi:hypothetical protein
MRWRTFSWKYAHIKQWVSKLKGLCQGFANVRIERRNTQSYIIDLLRPYAGPDQLNIEAFANLIETFDP